MKNKIKFLGRLQVAHCSIVRSEFKKKTFQKNEIMKMAEDKMVNLLFNKVNLEN